MENSVALTHVKDHSPRLWVRWINFEERLGEGHIQSLGPLTWTDFNRKSIAIVGTRKPSTYGILFVRELIKAIREYDFNILSGGALGIDAEAHQCALANGMKTQAWLVGPLKQPSPRSHYELFRKIKDTSGCGIVVPQSLEPTGVSSPRPTDWLCRNRWLTAAADALVVIEASLKSGTWSSAEFAEKVGIPVFILPGSVFSRQSEGTNAMISRGYGTPILSVGYLAKALIAELGGNPYNNSRRSKAAPAQGELKPSSPDQVPPSDNKLLEFLRNCLSPGRALGIQEAWSLAKGSPYSVSEILEGLEVLVASGELTKAGDRFERKGALL